MKSTVLLSTLWTAVARALSAAEWETQSIYQVMTDRFALTSGSTTASCDLSEYCGGTWQGIINHLDYIQGMGFTAIWISPIVTNIEDYAGGGSYHGYWAQDITTVNSQFGTEQDLIDLSTELHDRGMYLMVDVVTNHMGYDGDADSVDYSIYTPFSSQSYFHTPCAIDYDNTTSTQVCWEETGAPSLPDLRTEDDDVRSMFNSWITPLIEKYSIDGLRMDSVLEVEQSFWPQWEDAAGVFNMGEIYDGDPSIFPGWFKYIDGALNYPNFFWITQAFESTSGSISNLVNGINTLKGSMATSTFGSFLENHDQPRFPSLTSDENLIKNAIAFAILADGIPIVYQGQEQGYSGGDDPNNREPLWTSGYSTTSTYYTYIATLIKTRAAALATDSAYTAYQANPIYSDTHNIVMRKSTVLGFFTNAGTGSSGTSVSLTASETGYTAGESLTDVLTCTVYTADSSGGLTITVGPAPIVLLPTASLDGLCGSTGGTSPTGGSTATKTTSTATSTATSCSSVPVTFSVDVTTVYGQTIKISGSVSQLGSWDTSDAITLSASAYTTANPVWKGTINLPPGTVVEYKFINVASDGTVTWEADPNRSLTVPTSCAAITVTDTWQS